MIILPLGGTSKGPVLGFPLDEVETCNVHANLHFIVDDP